MLDLPHNRGFSLLELIVVLVLISMLAGLAFPSLLKFYERLEVLLEQDEVVMRINGLGRRAFVEHQAFALGIDDFELPESWSLEVREPIRYTVSGVCLGGHLTIKKTGQDILQQQLKAPYCQISR